VTPLSPAERRVLLGLVLDPSRLTCDETSDAGIRWTDLGAVAARHGVAPLVYRGLRELGGDEALADAAVRLRDRCRDAYVRNVARNARIFAELARVLGPLRRAGIPVILLKGVAVTAAFFGDIGLRHMRDIDLLVPVDARARALALLEGLGYRLGAGAPADLRARGRRAGLLPAGATPLSRELTGRLYERYHFHYYLERDQQPFPLELHWHIVKAGRGVRIEDLWHEARPARIGDVEALCLRPEHALLHFALHQSQDDYGELRLARLVDLHLAVTRQALDAPYLLRSAERHRASRELGVALDLARRVLGTPVPPALQGLLGRFDGALVARLARQWIAELGPQVSDREPVRQVLAWTVLRRDRWRSVPAYLYRRLAAYPESNPRLPARYRGSELMNLLYALHPSRIASLIGGSRVRGARGAASAGATKAAYPAEVTRST